MGMNPQLDLPAPGLDMGLYGFHDFRDLVWQSAAVGITKHQTFRSAGNGPVQGGQGIIAVILKTVKKMLGVIEEMFDVGPQVRQGILNDSQISQVFPKMVIAGDFAATRAWRLGSISGGFLKFLVLPKAVTMACLRL